MLVRERIFVRLYTGSRKYLNIYRGKLLCSLYVLRVLHNTFYNFINIVITRDCYDYIDQIWNQSGIVCKIYKICPQKISTNIQMLLWAYVLKIPNVSLNWLSREENWDQG